MTNSTARLQHFVQGFLALVFVAAGLANLAGAMQADMMRLAYPNYFSTLLGVGYILGVLCLYQNKYPFLQEWALGAFAASLVGAAGSHVLAGDPISRAIPAIVLLAIFVWNYWLRSKLADHRQHPSV